LTINNLHKLELKHFRHKPKQTETKPGGRRKSQRLPADSARFPKVAVPMDQDR
jgi:hypothetical protein